MASDTYGDFDDQDGAEAFDEDNQSLDGEGRIEGEMKTFEELPDVFDSTRKAGDSDDDVALTSEELDDADVIALEADADSTDVEDDDLAGRMPEAFDDDSLGEGEIEELPVEGEMGLDARGDDEGRRPGPASEAAMGAPGEDEAELELSADTDRQLEATDEAEAADLESDTLDDADLQDLGYRKGR